MHFLDYTYYTVFCIMMVFSPGPMTMLLMTIGAENGLKKTMPAQLGASSAYFLSLCIFAVGLTALLQQYYLVLKIIQLIGICYILYLAWKQWQNAKNLAMVDVNTSNITISSHQLYWRGLVTGLSNPKTIVMFSTVIPQFTKNVPSRVSDLVILSAIFLVLQFFSGITYSYFGQAIKLFLRHEKYKKIVYRIMAVLLVIVAIMIARA